MPPHGKPDNRRTFLKKVTTAGLFTAVAGCTGQDSSGQSGDTTTASTPTATEEPSQQTTTTESGSDLSEDEQWRQDTAQKAADELSGDEQLIYMVANENRRQLDLIRSNNFDPPYDVLTGKINVVQGETEALINQYSTAQDQGEQILDCTDMNMARLLDEGYEFTPLSDIPAYYNAPDYIQNDEFPEYGATFLYGYGLSYNTDLVSEPPQTWQEMLDPKWKGEKIALDWTPPTLALQYLFDKEGAEFFEGMADQNPSYGTSLSGVVRKTAQGTTHLSFLGNSANVITLGKRGAPILPVDNSEVWMFRSKPHAIAGNPLHPNAAKLFTDWLMTSPAVQTARPGTISIDKSIAHPQSLTSLFSGKVWGPWDLKRPAQEIQEEYQELVDAPV